MSSSTKAILSKNSTMNNNDRKRPISSSIRLSPSQTAAKRRGLSSSSLSSSISRKSTNHIAHRLEHDERILTKTDDTSDRQSRSEQQQQQQQQQQYRPLESTSPSSMESSRSSSASTHPIKRDKINPDYSPASASRSLYDSHRAAVERKQHTSKCFDGTRTLSIVEMRPAVLHFDETNDRFILGAHEQLPMQNAQLNSVDSSHKSSERQKEAMLTKKFTPISLLVKPSASAVDQRTPSTMYDSDEEYERIKHTSNNPVVKVSRIVHRAPRQERLGVNRSAIVSIQNSS